MDVNKKALELCWEIEKLTASEQQTKTSQLANELRKGIEDIMKVAFPSAGCPKCGCADIDRIHHDAAFATPEVAYWQCAECECQWGHG